MVPSPGRTFSQQMAPVQAAVGKLLREGASLTETHTANTCRNLLKWESSLWTFVRTPAVEPTNNRAERAVRAAVLYRNVSFGTQCSAGSRFVERVMTAVATCKQHRCNVLDYLTAAVTAAYHGQTAPSLLSVASTPP